MYVTYISTHTEHDADTTENEAIKAEERQMKITKPFKRRSAHNK